MIFTIAYIVLSIVLGAQALLNSNLNYQSPSRRQEHVILGIDIPLVERRAWKRNSEEYAPDELNFTHGIASGDPWPESVILWTRIAPTGESDTSNVTVEGDVPLYNHDTQPYIDADPHPVCLEWSVFKSNNGTAAKEAVTKGTAFTTSDIDFTVKVEARGLEPFTDYFYQFVVCNSENKSPLGKTKTAPREDDHLDEISLAVFSCSNYPRGYFNAYGNAARRQKHDFVVHLGDYIYENADPTGERAHKPPHVLFSLHDYRTRHNQYRTDPDLQLLSKDWAWIPTWDDHEIANNGYRDGYSDLDNTEESFLNDGPRISVDQRKMNAVRAYFEWMPIRQVDLDDNLRIWRNFKMGDLFDLIILDTRYYDRSIADGKESKDYIDLIRFDAGRSIMGSRQENWFFRQLSESQDRGAVWRVVGNQVMFSHRIEDASGQMAGDDWNAYTGSRNRTLKHIYDKEINNNIFLAGDSHQNWVADLTWTGKKPYDPDSGDGSVGVELAGTAVSSGGRSGPLTSSDSGSRTELERNSVFQWQDGYYRGYFILHLNHEKMTAQFFGSPSVATRNGWDLPLANLTMLPGVNHLERPVAGGRVETGALRGGEVKHTNLTFNTETNEWKVIGFEKMYL
ncbi:unnamed protein product [Clonostachys byssicola]|uniref:Alkaline phosphatase D n=1 Tax=Clonostachys byssicola TaxID=160290 RepID=A0A9N9U6R4_9HYPO|nr:unnamed protein product [Clonostachys byssicola]